MYRVNISAKPESQKMKDYIIEQIESKYEDGPERSYLLQCATWGPNDHFKEDWVAYSPIPYRYSPGYWPLYSIDLRYVDETKITFHSYKGDYEKVKYTHNPSGNLPYNNGTKNFKGTIWTRG